MVEKLTFDTVLFWLIGGASAKKSSQKSENMDIGCSEYWQKYFGVGRPVASFVYSFCFSLAACKMV